MTLDDIKYTELLKAHAEALEAGEWQRVYEIETELKIYEGIPQFFF